MNAALRQPVFFHKVIALGGNYSIRNFTDGVSDSVIFQNDPQDYMAHLNDAYRLEQIKRLDIRLVTGEHDMCWAPTQRFSEVLNRTGVSHTYDVWGNGTGHDWIWWQAMIRKHIL
jgi:esterase/lipase superfamily enzyme